MVINILFQLLFITTFVLLILARKKAVHAEQKMSGTKLRVVIVVVMLLLGVNVVYFGRAYYHFAYPDDKREEVQSAVGYHLYKPASVAPGRKQASAFTPYQQEFPGKNIVRVVFDAINLQTIESGAEGGRIIMMFQSQVEPDFDLKAYATEKNPDRGVTREITFKGLANQQSFGSEGGIVTQLYILMPDNVLILLISPREKLETLVNMAETLE